MSLDVRVVLVEPLYQGNVGSVTRVMKNFGFSDLVLVNPCKLEDEARAMSSHARDILDNARIVSTLKEAVEGTNIVIGTTGSTGSKNYKHIRMPYFIPRELKEQLAGVSGTIAILFGREDQGFNNDEMKACDMILTIPTSEIYSIMNLSHAVGIVLYELSDVKAGEIPLAEGLDLVLLHEHLEEMMEDIEYPPHKKDKTMLMFKRIFGRAQLIPREVQTMRGVIGRIQRKI